MNDSVITTRDRTLVPAGTWSADPVHSTVGFAVKHLGIATVRGTFDEFEGALEISEDDGAARAYGTVRGASVNTRNARRDRDLRSAALFGVEQNPEIRFESTQITQLKDRTLQVVGDLVMNGVTGQITLTARLQGTQSDPWGHERVALEVTGRLNRSDWNLNFKQALRAINGLVGDQVDLQLDICAVKQA